MKDVEERIEALEKRVAELEEELKAQPEKMCEYVSRRICESLAGDDIPQA